MTVGWEAVFGLSIGWAEFENRGLGIGRFRCFIHGYLVFLS